MDTDDTQKKINEEEEKLSDLQAAKERQEAANAEKEEADKAAEDAAA